jgi:3-hydroxyisobutyrate dehydrogenase
MEKIGFIGLGGMGKPMAKNLIHAGYSLTVWNRTEDKMEELVALGAKSATSPKEVAENSKVTITIVSDSPDVNEVVLGPSGVVEGVQAGDIIIDMSTISPKITQDIARTLSKYHVFMLDAPVSGGDVGAMNGTLSIMIGGPEEVYKQCLPIFQVLGRKITYMGKSGMGQATKLCNQVICGLNIEAVCEGLILGAKLGLDLEKLLQVVTAGAAGSWMLSNLGPKILKRDFEPGFKITHQQKDLRLALTAAAEKQIPLPGTALVHQILRIVEAEGEGEKGTQAAIRALELMAQLKISTDNVD